MQLRLASIVFLGVLVLGGCKTVDDGRAETRPLGEPVLSAEELAEAKVAVSFKDHVQPILEERCLHCHNTATMPGKFSLATRSAAFEGSRIVPGDSGASTLIIALTTGNHALAMPAVGMAPPEVEIDVLRRWIDAGAVWPEGVTLRARQQ